jgi:hypothetical protein
MSSVPTVSRYSQLYIARPKPTSDSRRFRVRLGSWISEKRIGPAIAQAALQAAVTELGLEYHSYVKVTETFSKLLLDAEICDVLDLIIYIFLWLRQQPGAPERDWAGFVARAFVEQSLAYTIDDRGVVHPFIDAEFDHNRSSALLVLSDPRFAEARKDFEEAFRHLRNGEGKQAARMMFPAIEVAAKVLFPGKFSGFSNTEIDKFISAKMQAKYVDNAPALAAGKQLLASFKNWINASQLYRHGQEVFVETDIPPDLLVAYLSSGAAFLRWMIELCG